MKFKYFLRGLGVGIIFASIIFLTAYQGKASEYMTDAEIMRRAKKLGMIEQEDKVGDLLKDKDNSETEQTENADNEQGKEDTSETEQDATEKETEEKETTEKENDKKTTEKEEADDSKKDNIEITIERGDSSYPVCQKLETLGMIENASEFDTYLVQNGYADRIRVGTHILKKGMSFRDIADAISDPL